MKPSTRRAIDSLISEICQSCDRLEDIIEEDREVLYTNSSKGEDDTDPEEVELGNVSGNVRIRGMSSCPVFNFFPSSKKGGCKDVMFILLPRSPKVGPMGPEDAKAFSEEYFTAAVEALTQWAEFCKGKTLVVLSDTWPLPGNVNIKIRWPWRINHSRHRHWTTGTPGNGNVHRRVGQILEGSEISCEVQLFTSRGNVTRIPDPNPLRWPPGW
jgi:hypothetical protein